MAKVRLDNAKQKLQETRPNATVSVHYHPFMIDPGTQPDGESYHDYNRRRWGSDGWTASMKKMGRKEGAPYANWVIWPNTTHCSRLLLFADRHGLGDAVVEKLYRACYEEGQNVSLKETVARVATEVGVPGGAEYVMSDAGHEELMASLHSSKARNGKRVSAAPTFSLRIGHTEGPTFSGAQDTAAWLELLEQCAEYAEAHAPALRSM